MYPEKKTNDGTVEKFAALFSDMRVDASIIAK